MSTAVVGGDQAEKERWSELSRYAHRSLTSTHCPPTPLNGLRSALEEIERRSRVLLEKHTAARLLDKGEDSKEVARLIDGLREAITHYQVSENGLLGQVLQRLTRRQISQQQAIYHQVTDLAVRAL